MANQDDMGGHFVARSLSDEDAFDVGGQMAQTFSACIFSCLAIYMVLSNTKKLKDIQASSFEERLKTCCQINLVIATLSAFLNFFQLTEVDNYMLPGQTSVVVDVCRPLEWILTCPLMQLSLVLMGGTKIPGYRRYLMPILAAITLLFGTSTLFVESTDSRILLFVAGVVNHVFAMSMNHRQIKEHSDGEEGLFHGDSEYRKCTIVLMMTWFPFPIWFLLSPEGVGLIDNLVTVQMGWAFLNILAKGSFMFIIQRFKDNYAYHMHIIAYKRQMKGKGLGKNEAGKGTEYDNYNVDGDEPLPPGAVMPEQRRQSSKDRYEVGDESTAAGSTPPGSASFHSLEFLLQALEARLGSKMEASFEKIDLAMEKLGNHEDLGEMFAQSAEHMRDRVNCGLADIEKKIDKVHWLTQTSNNMLEMKVETAFESNFKEQKSAAAQHHSMLEALPELQVKLMSEMHSNNVSTLGEMQKTIQQSMGETQQSMEELRATQKTVYDMMAGGSLTDMTDGWAAQIILDIKAAAFETQTKIGAVDLTSNKRHAEGLETITAQLELHCNGGMKKMASAVMQTTLKSAEELHASIDALQTSQRSESAQQIKDMTQQIKDMNQDCAKPVDAGIGGFGNSQQVDLAPIRQQLQTQVDQMYQKLQIMIQENMVNASNIQAGGFKELKGYMEEESRSHQGRHQDISSVVNTVLVQSCGAKASAEELASNMSRLRTIIMASMDQIGTIAGNLGGATTPPRTRTWEADECASNLARLRNITIASMDQLGIIASNRAADGGTQSTHIMSDAGSDHSGHKNFDGDRTPPGQNYDSDRPSGVSQTSRRPSADGRGSTQTSRYANIPEA